jgi:PucR-like helix-turn-helix protein/diguanylate cyclase with GGDEF domain
MDLAARLRSRHLEIEGAMLARVHAVSDPGEVSDPTYALGLRDTVGAALAYGIAAIERPGPEPAPVPEQLLVQARHAARSGVGLDTVLRRYFAGYTLLGDFLMQEAAGHDSLSAAELKRLLRAEAILFDRLVAAVSVAYARESGGYDQGTEHRRAERVRMLLAGELVDAAELGYELDAWHLGAIVAGPGARDAVRDLAGPLDCRLLAVSGEGTLWAWLGSRRRRSAREVLSLADSCWPAEARLSLGEPGAGMEGWRLSHRQAKAAFPVALRGARSLVAYTDVALLASALRDDVLASSLRDTFLAPLEGERDGGATARETLDAYFAAGRNASSAAAALGVSRKTVSIRLRSVEERLGRPLDRCAAEMETALCLQGLARDTGRP